MSTFDRTRYRPISEATENAFKSAEKFVCRLYKLPDDVDTCNKARAILFCNGHSQEALPPTSDVVKLHIKRAHYQAFIWKQANISTPIILPQASETGWTLVDGHLYAVLA